MRAVICLTVVCGYNLQSGWWPRFSLVCSLSINIPFLHMVLCVYFFFFTVLINLKLWGEVLQQQTSLWSKKAPWPIILVNFSWPIIPKNAIKNTTSRVILLRNKSRQSYKLRRRNKMKIKGFSNRSMPSSFDYKANYLALLLPHFKYCWCPLNRYQPYLKPSWSVYISVLN